MEVEFKERKRQRRKITLSYTMQRIVLAWKMQKREKFIEEISNKLLKEINCRNVKVEELIRLGKRTAGKTRLPLMLKLNTEQNRKETLRNKKEM